MNWFSDQNFHRNVIRIICIFWSEKDMIRQSFISLLSEKAHGHWILRECHKNCEQHTDQKSGWHYQFWDTTLSKNFIWKIVECLFSCQTERVPTPLHFKGNPHTKLSLMYMCCFYILVTVQPQDSTASRLHTFEYRISENSFLPWIVSPHQ